MNRNFYCTMTWLLWLALPLTALRYWMVWDKLPARMATHFDAAGHPNGWMTREASLTAALGILTLMLVIGTVVLRQVRKVDASAWAIWGLLGLVAGILYGAQEHTIRYNLTGEPVSFMPFIIVSALGTVVFLALYLTVMRGKPLADVNVGDVIAEEVHTGRMWTPLFLLPLVVAGATLTVARAGREPRIAVAVMSLVLLPVVAFAWDGFHYLITRRGLEIRTLGFRLRSIPAADIENYDVQGWNLLRGYGIRGIGADRAYVWGNRVVRIRTTGGNIYLGHSEPERIVNDLDRMRQLGGTESVAHGIKPWSQ